MPSCQGRPRERSQASDPRHQHSPGQHARLHHCIFGELCYSKTEVLKQTRRIEKDVNRTHREKEPIIL